MVRVVPARKAAKRCAYVVPLDPGTPAEPKITKGIKVSDMDKPQGSIEYHPAVCPGPATGFHCSSCTICLGKNRDPIPWTELFTIGLDFKRVWE